MPNMDDLARTERVAWEVVEGRPADDAARVLCDVLGHCDAYASLIDPVTGRGLGEGFAYLDPALIDLMAREFATPETSPFLRAMPCISPDMFHHCTDIIDMDELRHTDFYGDWWVPSGVRDHAGGIMLPAPDGRLVWVVIGCLGHRDWLDADELRYAEAACGTIARALRTTAAMSHGEANATLLALAPDPSWLLGADGHLHLANAAAHDPGVAAPMRRRNGGIALADADAQERLSVVIATVQAGLCEEGSVLVARENGFARLTVEAGPSYRDEGTTLLTLRAPRPMAWTVDDLREAFGLTPSEGRVALALASGASTAETAAMLGVNGDTVRIYLKRVYAKVGVRDRSALVALLLRGAGTA